MVLKLSTAGALVWTIRLASASSVQLSHLVTNANDLVIGGTVTGNSTLDNGFVTNTMGTNVILVKMNMVSGIVTNVLVTNSSSAMPTSLIADNFGNVLLAGRFRGMITLNQSSTVSQGPYEDAFVAKILPDNSVAWLLSTESSNGNSRIDSIAVDTSSNTTWGNNLFIAGTVRAIHRLGNSLFTNALNGTLLANLNASDGSILWFTLGPFLADTNATISRLLVAYHPSRFVFLSGSYYASQQRKFSSSLSLPAFDPPTFASFSLRFNTSGVPSLVTTWNAQSISNMMVDSRGFLYYAGQFNNSFQIAPNNTLTQVGIGYFLTKLGNCLPCQAGRFSSSVNAPSCAPCPASTFNSKLGAAVCLEFCYGGEYSPPGSTNRSACSDCAAGLYFTRYFSEMTRYGSSADDTPLGVAVDQQDNLYTAGIYRGAITISGVTLPAPNVQDFYITKQNVFGSMQWIINGGGPPKTPTSMAVDPFGNVFVYGAFAVGIQIGSSILQPTVVGNNNCFLAKFNTNGQFQWAKKFGMPHIVLLLILRWAYWRNMHGCNF